MTKRMKSIVVAIVIGSTAITPAWADHYGHYGGGNYGGRYYGGDGWDALGFALFGTALYLAATAPPPVAYPAPAYVPYAPGYGPPTYVQQPVAVVQPDPPPAPVAQQNWWYYCGKPAGYYPYVSACPSGWTRVSPVPPDR